MSDILTTGLGEEKEHVGLFATNLDIGFIAGQARFSRLAR